MENETLEILSKMVDAVESIEEIEVTQTDVKEYVRGDPTTDDSTTTGAEIDVKAYLSFDSETDEENPFRCK